MLSHALITMLALFIPTFVALVFAQNRAVRSLYIIYFMCMFLAPGLGLIPSHWPFFSWYLYADQTQPTVSFSEVRVADASGNEIKYDARAAPPTMQTPVVRFGRRFETLEPKDAVQFAAFLLARANGYARYLSDKRPSPIEYLRFPRHQYGFRWTKRKLNGIGPFVELRIVEVQVIFSADGRQILFYNETRRYTAR